MERKNTGQLSLACTGNLRDNRQPRRLGSVLPSSNAKSKKARKGKMWSTTGPQLNQLYVDNGNKMSLTPFVERLWGGALCDDTKNGCVADYYC